jgi:predicted DNA-binding protein with PD1-like motif
MLPRCQGFRSGYDCGMEYKQIANDDELATYALIFSQGDEAAAELGRFANETGVDGAELQGVGAASSAVLGWFDFDAKNYRRIPIDEQVEVVSFLGDIATTQDGKPQVHAHLVVAKRDGSAFGGHLLELHVKPTLEVIVTETATHLRKKLVPGLPVATIRLSEST